MNTTRSIEDRAPPTLRAAQYVRMSTDHQKYSIQNQFDAIARYAKSRGFEVVRTYADAGKSGLRLKGRESLQQLLADVVDGKADYSDILVYDVSRWGRFQDADEGAYHEFTCRQAGVKVHYCAEQFDNDGSVSATIIKSIKRVMAGEYSRELSVKVFGGQARQVRLGFRAGAPPGYAMRRMMVDEHGRPKRPLGPGEQKSLRTDHVILVPGPPDEVAVVRRIFEMFVSQGVSEIRITEILNAEGLKNARGGPWREDIVRHILRSEKYIGNNVYNRSSYKLRSRRTLNPRDRWVRSDGVFEAIIEQETFEAAQRIIHARHPNYTDQELLDRLSACLAANGRLSCSIIDNWDMPTSTVYRGRFGRLLNAYALIGYGHSRNYSYVEYKPLVRRLRLEINDRLIGDVEAAGGFVRRVPRSLMLLVNDQFSASVVVVPRRTTKYGHPQWHLNFEGRTPADITVVARLTPDNVAVQDYHLLPSAVFRARGSLCLGSVNKVWLDAYRFTSLDGFCELVGRLPAPS